MERSERGHRRGAAVLAFAALTASQGLLLLLVTLALWAVVPAAFGWHSVVVSSGSMEPGLPVGSVLVAQPGEDRIVPGAILLVDRPGDDPLSHRMVAEGPDGIVTKGDANPIPDTTPVRREDVLGVTRLVVPIIGRLAAWWAAEAYWHLGLAAALVLLAAAVVARYWLARPPARRRSPRAALAAWGAASALLVALPTALHLAPADAAAAATTANPGNSWVTGAFGTPAPSGHVVDTTTGGSATPAPSGHVVGTTTGGSATPAMTMPLSVPAGLRAGDVLVATLTADMNPSFQIPKDWTKIIDKGVSNNNARVFAYYHLVTDPATEPAAYSWNLYDTGQAPQLWGGVLTAVRGVKDPTAYPPTLNSTVATGTGTTISVPMSGSVGPAVQVSGVGADTPSGGFTAPDGWTEIGEGSGGQGAALAYRELPAGGGGGTATWGRPQSGGAAGWVLTLLLEK